MEVMKYSMHIDRYVSFTYFVEILGMSVVHHDKTWWASGYGQKWYIATYLSIYLFPLKI